MNSPGIIYTFYSYKGGVGRSMAVANVAALMAKSNQKILVVDFDLEAPGIEMYFQQPDVSALSDAVERKPGIVDIIHQYKEQQNTSTKSSSTSSISWRDCLINVNLQDADAKLDIISAGRFDDLYIKKLQQLDWVDLFKDTDFGNYLESIRAEWKASYDFVIVDSRTGITDIGGICTIHLPDILVFFFTTNEASINGCKTLMSAAIKRHQKLPFERNRLIAIPVPARDESRTEYESAIKWRKKIARDLDEFYADWVHMDYDAEDVLEVLRIPYIPYWSFGERLPVLEEGVSDPTGIGYAYDVLARLLISRIRWEKVMPRKSSMESIKGDETEEGFVTEGEEKRYIQNRLLGQIDYYRKLGTKSRSRFRIYMFTIFFTFILAVINGIILIYYQPMVEQVDSEAFMGINYAKYVVSGIVLLVALLFQLFYFYLRDRFKDKSKMYFTLSAQLEREYQRYKSKLGEYNAKDRFSTLVQTIEELIIDHQTASNIKSSSSTLKT